MNWLIILPNTQRTKTDWMCQNFQVGGSGIGKFDNFCNETTTFHRFHAKIILKIPNIFPLSSVAGQPVQIPWPLPTNRHASAP